nr:histone deacetylase 8 [Ipomoea batatas]GME11226.1 histone deacetylase 8 [Ipomoea batatas]
MEGYRELGRAVRAIADEYSNGKLLIVQEGGYHITYSAYCLHAALEGVLNVSAEPLLPDPIAHYPEDEWFSIKDIEAIRKYLNGTAPFLKDDAWL